MCGWIAVRTARSGWRETAGGWAAAGSLALPLANGARAEASFVKQTVRRGGSASIESGIAFLPAVIQICAWLSIMCARGGQTRHGGGKGDRLE